MNAKVNLFKRVRISTRVRCCPVVESANGRIKPNAVVVDGKEEKHPEGAYYLSWYEGKRVKRESVGKDPVEASNRWKRKAAELNAKNNGVDIVTNADIDGHRLLSHEIARYLAEVALTAKPKTLPRTPPRSVTSPSPATRNTCSTSSAWTC